MRLCESHKVAPVTGVLVVHVVEVRIAVRLQPTRKYISLCVCVLSKIMKITRREKTGKELASAMDHANYPDAHALTRNFDACHRFLATLTPFRVVIISGKIARSCQWHRTWDPALKSVVPYEPENQ